MNQGAPEPYPQQPEQQQPQFSQPMGPPVEPPKKSRRLWFILGGALVLIVVAALLVFFSRDTAVSEEDAAAVESQMQALDDASVNFTTPYAEAKGMSGSPDNVYLDVQDRLAGVEAGYNEFVAAYESLKSSPELERVLKNRKAKETFAEFEKVITEETIPYIKHKALALGLEIKTQRVCLGLPYYDSSSKEAVLRESIGVIDAAKSDARALQQQLESGSRGAQNGVIDFNLKTEQALSLYDDRTKNCVAAAQEMADIGGLMGPYGEVYMGLVTNVRVAYEQQYKDVASGVPVDKANADYKEAMQAALKTQMDRASEFVAVENEAGEASDYTDELNAFMEAIGRERAPEPQVE